MDNDTLIFKFDGPDVCMKTFGRDLIPLLQDVYEMVSACSGDVEPEVLSIENNCITIKMTAAAAVLASTLACHDAEVGASQCDVARFNRASNRISNVMRSRNASLKVSIENGDSLISVASGDDLPTIKEVKRRIFTTTTLYGRLSDVGGTNPNAHIITRRYGEVIISVDEQLARQLAKRLYELVGVNVNMQEVGGEVKNCRAIGIVDYHPIGYREWARKNGPKMGYAGYTDERIDELMREIRG